MISLLLTTLFFACGDKEEEQDSAVEEVAEETETEDTAQSEEETEDTALSEEEVDPAE
jgi:hypothetical protein